MRTSAARHQHLLFVSRSIEGGAGAAFVTDASGEVLVEVGSCETEMFLPPNHPLPPGEIVHYPTSSGELVVVATLDEGAFGFAVFPGTLPAPTARSVVQAAAFGQLQ